MRKFIFTMLLAIIGSAWIISMASERWCLPSYQTETESLIRVSGVLVPAGFPCEPDEECPTCKTIQLQVEDGQVYYLTANNPQTEEQLDTAHLATAVIIEGIPFTRGSYNFIEVNNISYKFCTQYNLSVSVYLDGTIKYTVSGSQDQELLHVDSIWITGRDTSTIIMVSHAQPQEKIDVSFLPRGSYILFAQIGDCITARRFLPRSPKMQLPSLCDEWHIEVEETNADLSPRILRYTQRLSDDTIIGGRQYRQLREQIYPSPSLHDGDYLGALREDLNANIYYVPAGSTHEYLLYAFNVEVGDTLTNLWIGNHASESYGYKAKVTSIATGKFRRTELQVFETDDNKDIDCWAYTYWLDSIGRPFGPVWAEPVCFAVDPTPQVLCAYKEGRKVYTLYAGCECFPLRLPSLCDEWNILSEWYPDGIMQYSTHTERLTTDTIIGGQRYVKLEGKEYRGALREGSNADFYIIPPHSTHEYLLYAFHAQVGDVFDNVWFGGSPSDFPYGCETTITEIEEVNGYKKFNLSVELPLQGMDGVVIFPGYSWIDGVGLHAGPSGSDCPLDCEGDFGTSVLCAYKDGEQVYTSETAEEFGCYYDSNAQPVDTVPLYTRVNDGPGSSTVDPVDPNEIVATLRNDQLTIREFIDKEIGYTLGIITQTVNMAPARNHTVQSDTFSGSVSVRLTESGTYELELTNPEWNYSIVGTFIYMPAGVEDTPVTAASAQKVLINGRMLIKYGDKVYTLTGMQVE